MTTAAASRRLDHCGACALVGEAAADELFGLSIPAGIDLTAYGNRVMVDSILRDKAKCRGCDLRDGDE